MSETIIPTQAIARVGRGEKDWTPAKVAYSFLMAIALLSHIWLIAIGAGVGHFCRGPVFFPPAHPCYGLGWYNCL